MTEWLRCQIRIAAHLILFEGAGSNPAVVVFERITLRWTYLSFHRNGFQFGRKATRVYWPFVFQNSRAKQSSSHRTACVVPILVYLFWLGKRRYFHQIIYISRGIQKFHAPSINALTSGATVFLVAFGFPCFQTRATECRVLISPSSFNSRPLENPFLSNFVR